MTSVNPEKDEVKEDLESGSEKKEEKNDNSSCLTPRRKEILIRTASLLAWIAVLEGVGLAIGRAYPTDAWYDALNKPAATPPGIGFAIAWPLLYLLLSIFGWVISMKLCDKRVLVVFVVFVLQTGLNWAWSPVFFGYHDTVASMVLIAIIIPMVLFIIIRLFFIDMKVMNLNIRYSGLIILPYLGWLCFATFLNIYILANNERST